MSKFTPWFPKRINPARSGWYQVDGNFLENETAKEKFKKYTVRFFDCGSNSWYWISPNMGMINAGFCQQDKWRGLKKESK